MVGFPALVTAGVPFVRIVSCNPLEIKDPDVPPTFSGYPAADRAGWAGVPGRVRRACTGRCGRTSTPGSPQQGAPPLPRPGVHPRGRRSTSTSTRSWPTTRGPGRSAPAWHRLDSSVRQTDEQFTLPAALAAGDGAADLLLARLARVGRRGLMQRVIDCLAATPHRYIVSMGPLHAEIELAPNMWGAEFLPQTSVLPLADLVITHGGNNTTTECLHFGKPMIVLPLFWDQYDNAQRMDELGLGVRLDPYRFTDAEMHGALDRLLADTALHARLAAAAATIQAATA